MLKPTTSPAPGRGISCLMKKASACGDILQLLRRIKHSLSKPSSFYSEQLETDEHVIIVSLIWLVYTWIQGNAKSRSTVKMSWHYKFAFLCCTLLLILCCISLAYHCASTYIVNLNMWLVSRWLKQFWF